MTATINGTKGVTTAGLYTNGTFSDTFADGVVIDYSSPTGRIIVGASDGIGFYNNGIASPVSLGSISSAGVWTTTGDATIHGVTVGLGGASDSSNTVVGAGSAFGANSSGTSCVAIGYQSLVTNSSGGSNIAVGRGAMYSNSSGSNNVAIGQTALASNTTASGNTAVGHVAAYSNTTGSGITAVGYQVLYGNTTGVSNTAIGGADSANSIPAALTTNSTGSYNVAVGTGALKSNTTASNNTAVGYQAGYTNTTGTNLTYIGQGTGFYQTGNTNTAVGTLAMQGSAGSSSGTNNNAFGYATLYKNTTGSYNTGYGDSALFNNTTASYNTAVGYQAGYSNTTGATLTAVGYQAGFANQTALALTAVGYQAAKNATAKNAAFGAQTMALTTSGVANVAMGGGDGNVEVPTFYSNTTGSYNTALGWSALASNTTASSNVAVGYQAGYLNQTGVGNCYIGQQAGYNATGSGNTFIGSGGTQYPSGFYVTSGAKNTILGNYSGNQGGLDIRTASNYIVLSDGDGNPRLRYSSVNSTWQSVEVYNNTSASAANMIVFSDGGFGRSTSALKYKQDVRDLESIDINKFRPVRYKSKCVPDDQTVDHFGVIADEVDAAGIKELVTYNADGEVESFQYDRLTVVLLKAIQELKAEIDALKGAK